MVLSCQSVAQTLADVVTRRPVLEPVLRAFEDLLADRSALAGELTAAWTNPAAAGGPCPPEWQTERAARGLSLLAGAPLTGLCISVRTAAERLLPLLCAQESLASQRTALEAFFLAPPVLGPDSEPDRRDALARAMLSGDAPAFRNLADEAGLVPELLEFAAEFILSPPLRALAARAVQTGQVEREERNAAPWDEEGAWRQGYCPVCGSFPVIGWLDKPFFEEKNAFLSGGGGKKHLYCSLCGTNWKFRRGACPSCGKDGNGVMEILRESGAARGERLDWCTSCKTYCPTLDLRENDAIPDMDAMALGMLHLDMVAARKGLGPLKASFWNLF